MPDPVLLARIQFAFTVSFHIVFPTMSIGLALFLAIVEGLWLKTGDGLYLRIYRFWLRIFALGFGVGVVTGIVLSFQFGTNFSRFAQMAGSVLGPMIGLEVLTSFFLEAGFLGIMLFGFKRVGPRLHFLATCMVALGTILSASWILAANSWMQTPAGFAFTDGRFVPVEWLKVIFNPSVPYRLPHMLLAAYITASFLVAGVAAHYLLQQRHVAFARRTLSMALAFASVLIAAQVFLGDLLAGVVARHQPAKIQAIEGNWNDVPRADYLLVIVPDSQRERNSVQLGIPLLGSLLVTHSVDGTVPGLRNTPPADRPPMGPVFYGFRVMYLLGTAMFFTACAGLWLKWRGTLFESRRFLRLLVWMSPTGLLATLGGWYTAEIGRQPYVVYGQLRTVDAISPVPPGAVLSSLVAFVLIYGLFLYGFLRLTSMAIRKGPEGDPQPAGSPPAVRRTRPALAVLRST
ncbi:MAG: cytochrome ubiquinol oxidase subunit [Ramlibacter sp.]|nr:cytochrome ubiquinol oxidase subunit [Ramlibacter sp.]